MKLAIGAFWNFPKIRKFYSRIPSEIGSPDFKPNCIRLITMKHAIRFLGFSKNSLPFVGWISEISSSDFNFGLSDLYETWHESSSRPLNFPRIQKIHFPSSCGLDLRILYPNFNELLTVGLQLNLMCMIFSLFI